MFEQTITRAAWAEIERVEQLVAERDDAWAIPRVSAEFIHGLVLAGAFRRGLEVGTSYGYSGLWIGAALRHNGGSLITIENNPAKIALTRDTFQQAGLAETIRIIPGSADAVLRNLEGPFDFVFLDADKENTLRYFELIWPHLAHHATIVTDNITSHAAQMTCFSEHLRQHPQLFSTLIPIGSGLEVSVKLDPVARTASIDGADWVI
jgi:caffeoyl-CoA O-methyltransferase